MFLPLMRGLADFFVGVGMFVGQTVVNPLPIEYKNIPYENFSIKTADNILIKGTHLTRNDSVTNEESRPVVIVVHGISISRKHPKIIAITKDIYKKYDVISIDLRGHGESSGDFTGGESEANDVDAAIDYAKRHGYKNIGLIAFSAGGIASIKRQVKEQTFKAMVIVATPASPNTAKGEFTKLLCTDNVFLQGTGNVFMHCRGARIKVPLKVANALEIVDSVCCPVLFMQGKDDWIVDSEQARLLYEKAKEPKKLVILDSSEHAESLYNNRANEFRSEMMGWFGKYLGG